MNAKNTLQRITFAAGLIMLVFLACSPRAMAQDRAAHQMRFTICDPVEFPGRVLQPGTYYIRRDMPPQRVGKDAVIKVLDENQRHVLVTTVAIPAQRLEKGQVAPFIFYEAPAGTPAPVRTWFLPGGVVGYDFVYPKAHLEQLAAALHAAPVTATAEVTYSPLPEGPAPPVVEAPAPPPVIAENPPEPTPAPPVEIAQTQPPELPKTAGELPLVILIGSLSLFGCGVLRFARRH
jgi:hypothetical protein